MFTKINKDYGYPTLDNIDILSLVNRNNTNTVKYNPNNKGTILFYNPYSYSNSKNMTYATHTIYRYTRVFINNLCALALDSQNPEEDIIVPTAMSTIISRENYNNLHTENFSKILKDLNIATTNVYSYQWSNTLPDVAEDTVLNRYTRLHTVYISSGITFLNSIISEKSEEINRITHYEDILKALIATDDRANEVQFRVLYGDYSGVGHPNYYIFTNKMNAHILSAINILYFILSATYQNHEHYKETSKLLEKDITKENIKEDILPRLYKCLMTDICEKILQAMQNGTVDSILFNQIAENLDLYWKLKTLHYEDSSKSDFINNMQKAYNDMVYKADKENIKHLKDTIENYYLKISNHTAELLALERKLAYMQEYSVEEFNNFFETLKLYKSIEVLNADSHNIDIIIKAPLTYFDQADVKSMFNKPNSFVNERIRYNADGHYLNKELCKSIFRDIFINGTTTLHTFSAFKISLATSGHYNYSNYPVSINTGDGFSDITNTKKYKECLDNYLIQPHIMRYHCYRDAQVAFYKSMTELDFETALAQLIGATQNLTVSDSTVFSYLIDKMFANQGLKTYQKGDKYYSFSELYLEKEKEKEELEKKYKEPEVTIPVPEMTDIDITAVNFVEDIATLANALQEQINAQYLNTTEENNNG